MTSRGPQQHYLEERGSHYDKWEAGISLAYKKGHMNIILKNVELGSWFET